MSIATSCLIDLDADPVIPPGWYGFTSHIKRGMLEWNPKLFSMYFSLFQQNGKHIWGPYLQGEIVTRHDYLLLNANVLDYWLSHQDIIPEECKNPQISLCFWGTIYSIKKSRPQRYVRQLFLRDNGSFDWTYRAVDTMFDCKFPVAVYEG